MHIVSHYELKLNQIDKCSIDTILKYLTLNDVKNWSITNKYWRDHFTPTLFSSLSLMFPYRYNHRVFSYRDEYFDWEIEYFQKLADDWIPHTHLVREVKIFKELSICSIDILFNQFENITCLKFFGLIIEETNLLSILKRVKQLEELYFMDARVCTQSEGFDQEDYFRLPSGLKVLHIDTNSQFDRVPLPFKRFDHNHRLIREMTCLNANMVTNFIQPYPTLAHIDIRNDPSFSSDIVRNILESNPQLRSLGICSNYLDEFNMNLVLNLKQLHSLFIIAAATTSPTRWTLVHNTCIKSLTLSGVYTPWLTRTLLYSLKTIKSLKLSHVKIETTFDSIDLYSPTVEFIKLVRFSWELLDFRPFSKFEALRKIALREVYPVNAIEHIGREVERLAGWCAHLDRCKVDVSPMEVDDKSNISK